MKRLTALATLGGISLLIPGALSACAGSTNTDEDDGGGGSGTTTSSGMGGQGGSAVATTSTNGGSCADGETRACYTGDPATDGIGVCAPGTQTCENGVFGDCEGEVLPEPMELCNGQDDDCDGFIDEDDPGGGADCMTGSPGICDAGVLACSGGGLVCVPNEAPATELCDGIDNDCDGTVDNGNPEGGASCIVQGALGVCAQGTLTCAENGNGMLECVSTTSSSAETCDGFDNDCDGSTDEGNLCAGSLQACVNGQCVVVCPYVLSHDGRRYVYESSVGGAMRRVDGDDELAEDDYRSMWIALSHAAVTEVDGRRQLRAKVLAAEDEIVFLRQARLRAVDHAVGEIALPTNFADYRALGQTDPGLVYLVDGTAARTAERALRDDGLDVTAALSTRNRMAAPTDPTRPNRYALHFGHVGEARELCLVLHGWKRKEHRGLSALYRTRRPRLEVLDPDGRWREVARIPTPRGDDKPVVIDLGAIDNRRERLSLRVSTGTHQSGQSSWYLDQATVVPKRDLLDATVGEDVAATLARLDYSGPPRLLFPNQADRPRTCIDDGRGAPTAPHDTIGRLTAYGDITPWVGADDDRVVVMARGDAVELTFTDLPEATEGRAISWFLEVEALYAPRLQPGEALTSTRPAHVHPVPVRSLSGFDELTRAAWRRMQRRRRVAAEDERATA